MNNMMMDIDPLSYEAQYGNYSLPNPYYTPLPVSYPYKDQYPETYQPPLPETTTNITPTEESTITENEVKDIKPNINTGTKKKVKGKTSNYWNKKISDKDFAFYGCSVCNIAYTELQELDQHVIMHSNRMTSYDLRIQNLKKRKRLKKIKKKEKKDKIKQEVDIEIKPEDGFIGTEKVSDFIKDEKDNIKSSVTENNENKPENNKNVDNQNCVNVYKCFGCNKQFALSYYLKIHVRSHTDEKPYTCSECGQSFITASKLGRHNKRIHLSVRHQCRICYKHFSRFELLVKHFDKKHAEDKLEGEPYDYNTILPYLKELEEEQQKLEKEKKPKLEDIWEQYLPEENAGQNLLEIVPTKEEKVEDKETTVNIQVTPDLEPLPTANILVEEHKYEVDIKVEMEDLDRPGDQDMDAFDNDGAVDGDNDFKEERNSASDEEYFPSDTWARPPSTPMSPRVGGREATTCHVCNKKLSTKSYLRIHMRTHTGEKPFICYICNRGFITASKMHRHVLTHDESWEGNNGIKPEVEVKSENETEDSKKTKGMSKVAKAKAKLLKKPKKTLEKKQKNYKKRPYVCEFCHQRFLHTETLQVHRKSHEGETLVLQCHYCLEPAADEAALKEHEATHTGAKPYLCNICGNAYKKRETMVYHRKNHKTTDDKTFICDICSKKFNSQTKLQRHIISHSVAKFSLHYECPVCAHMFHTRYHVQMHLNTHMKEGLISEENRSEVLAMVLQNARKIPKAPEGVVAQDNISTDERSRICNICGQIFQHFYYLEEHLKTHGSKIAIEDVDKEEEKKYTCQVCSKSFKLHYYLKLHIYTHTKEKPFICQQCGKGFITKGKLKRHLETHQGLKKYQCHICYKFFTRPSYLRIHVRTIHGTQDNHFRDYGIGVPIGVMGNS